jgi:hypothetical protein
MDTTQSSPGDAAENGTEHAADVECRIDALAQKVAQSAHALGTQCDALRREFDKVGLPLRNRAKGWADTATAQARAHPLAAFGIAFAAGAILARALRR